MGEMKNADKILVGEIEALCDIAQVTHVHLHFCLLIGLEVAHSHI
jgi:hypothetical protein